MASTVKIAVAAAYLSQVDFGRRSLDDRIGSQSASSLIEAMLIHSDNIATDRLIRNLGGPDDIDDWLDEEPGKMIHQARNGPLSVLGDNPHLRYYGDWATPPDFLIMLGQYLAWTDDRATIRTLLPAARAALDWGFRFGDPDGDGFLEYDTRSSKGVKNQGWKDSHDAVIEEDGSIVPNPIAASEIQAYWYAGLQQAAVVFAAFGDEADVGEFEIEDAGVTARGLVVFDKTAARNRSGAYCEASADRRKKAKVQISYSEITTPIRERDGCLHANSLDRDLDGS